MILIDDKTVEEFLSDHPEIDDALKLFGISRDQYEQLLLKQLPPEFYISDNTKALTRMASRWVANPLNVSSNLTNASLGSSSSGLGQKPFKL